MACEEKLVNLPIDDRYKQVIRVFCSDPENASACQLLCETPEDVLVKKFAQVEDELSTWVEQGPPQELTSLAQQEAPEFAQATGEFLANEGPRILDRERQGKQVQSFAKGGLASLGRFGDNDLVHAQKGEMVIPNHVFKETPGLRAEIERIMIQQGTNPDRYTVGGERMSVNPRTGRPEFFSLGGLVGGIIGFAVGGGPVGAAIGAGAGTYVETGDVGESLLMGLGAYGIAGAGVGMGWWGAEQAGFGTGLTGYWTAPGSTALGGMFADNAAAYLAKGATYSSEGVAINAGELVSAEVAAGADAGLAGFTPVPTVDPGSYIMTDALGGYTADPSQLMSAPVPANIGEVKSVAMNEAAKKAVTEKGKTGFFDDPMGWIGDNPEKAALYGMGIAGATGMLDAPPVPRPEGYSREGQEYGDKPYETMSPDQLFGGIAQYGAFPGAPGTPIGATSPSGTIVGGSPSAVTYGSYPVPSGSGVLGPYAAAWPTMPSYTAFAASGGHINGPGTETSDSIPAQLSDGEFVLTAKAVRGAGRGNIKAGARKLYALMDALERKA